MRKLVRKHVPQCTSPRKHVRQVLRNGRDLGRNLRCRHAEGKRLVGAVDAVRPGGLPANVIGGSSIDRLSRLYAGYGIYPSTCFTSQTPVQVFRQLYPTDHYSRDVGDFLRYQDYAHARKGADLPWWGKRYFEKEPGRRVLMVSQDSLAPDAGSVVFWMHLFARIASRLDLETFKQQLEPRYRTFRYGSYGRIQKQMNDWHLNLDFVFITDAAKVHKTGSWKDRDFDWGQSRELLGKEIDECRPDLIVLLGGDALSLLSPGLRYADAVEADKYILIGGTKSVVAPFPIGQGLTQP